MIFSLSADIILQTSLACPTVELIKSAPTDSSENSLELEMYTMTHGCMILSKEDRVQAIGYDPRNSHEKFQQVLYKRTGVQLYMLRESLQIEQGGKKSNFRF